MLNLWIFLSNTDIDFKTILLLSYSILYFKCAYKFNFNDIFFFVLIWVNCHFRQCDCLIARDHVVKGKSQLQLVIPASILHPNYSIIYYNLILIFIVLSFILVIYTSYNIVLTKIIAGNKAKWLQ